MADESQIKLRNATSSDIGFIFNSWLRSHRLSLSVRSIDNTVYFGAHHKLIEGLLKTCTVLIACNANDRAQIYGYVCAEMQEGIFIAHYVYVKESFRRLGLAKELLKAAGHEPGKPFFYTHSSKISETVATKKKMIYNPYLAYRAYVDTVRAHAAELRKFETPTEQGTAEIEPIEPEQE